MAGRGERGHHCERLCARGRQVTVRVEVWRGAVVESVHRVSVAVADGAGRVCAVAGDPYRPVLARSAIKPLQALPLVEDGGVDHFCFTDRELALCCASHNAEPFHLECAASMLRRIDADESALACGPHPPLGAAAARVLLAAGEEPGRLHNNCSGKHAGMLALARLHGWPLAGYHLPDHPVQRRMLAELERWSALGADEVGTAMDGCGVVTFALPLRALAGAFGRFAAAVRRGDAGPARIARAMTGHPEYVAGTGRLCTALMRAAGGSIVAKVGAEGVYCAAVPGAELGVALKVEDGAVRAAEPALLAVLHALGVLPGEALGALESFAAPELRNTLGHRVGEVRAVVELEADAG
jgi:L-asparaginase II